MCKVYFSMTMLFQINSIDIMSQFSYLSQGPATQYPESQDSGIGMDLYSSSSSAAAPARPRPSFATSTRRTLSRPPSWPNLNQETSSGRWKFSRQAPESQTESQVLGDMNKHIQDLDDAITTRMTDRTMIIVQEIVKMLQEEQSKEGDQVRVEISKLNEVADTIFESISSETNSELLENVEEILAATRVTLNMARLGNASVMERLDHLRQSLIEQLSKMTEAHDVSDCCHDGSLPKAFHNKPPLRTNIFSTSPSGRSKGFGISDCKIED